MQKVSYIGDGTTTEFYFNFPFFENTDIVVTINHEPATSYNIIGTSDDPDSDFPYTSGRVVFENAPAALTDISISRSLPLQRRADYQPTEKINPTTLNQDMNYTIELLKDFYDELDTLRTQYADIANKESTQILLARIEALGDVSQIRTNIETLQTDKLDKTLDNLPDASKQNIVSLVMPDYDHQIVGTITAAGTYITSERDSFVVVWGTDPFTESYSVTVKTPNSNIVCVGQRYDDVAGNTQTTSFTFLCPKNHSFTCDAESGFEYRIIPLLGAY